MVGFTGNGVLRGQPGGAGAEQGKTGVGGISIHYQRREFGGNGILGGKVQREEAEKEEQVLFHRHSE
jgi:hypothetical protein